MNIVDQILAGDVRAVARLLRDIDDQMPSAREILKELYPHTGKAYILGFTGSPGVGKSTLVDQMAMEYRKKGLTVGILAIDPTSPFTGGAILGDRIRMQRHFLDGGVFIRSLATRGHFGGLTISARAVINVLDAMGKDYILVETVGVGQDEVEIANAAHTTIVVTVPGLGDDIQAIKAGILEIGDLFVINKADREGVERTWHDLMTMIDMRYSDTPPNGWRPQVFKTEAPRNIGVAELMAAVFAHQEYLHRDGGCHLAEIMAPRLRRELLDLIIYGLKEQILPQLLQEEQLETALGEIAARRLDPYTVSDDLIQRLKQRCGLT